MDIAIPNDFPKRLEAALRDIYVPEIRAELSALLEFVLADARSKLDTGIRSIMDDAVKSIKNLVEVHIAPSRTAGLDIIIAYPLPKEEPRA